MLRASHVYVAVPYRLMSPAASYTREAGARPPFTVVTWFELVSTETVV